MSVVDSTCAALFIESTTAANGEARKEILTGGEYCYVGRVAYNAPSNTKPPNSFYI